MKGRVQSAFPKFEFSHEKYWIVDGTTVHLSTGTYSLYLLTETFFFQKFVKIVQRLYTYNMCMVLLVLCDT